MFNFVVHSVDCMYDNTPFNIHCENFKRIYIEHALIGKSADECQEENRCCPSPTDYRAEVHTDDLHQMRKQCDGKQNCNMFVGWDDAIPTDYGSVTYICSTKAPSKQTLHFQMCAC